MTFYKALTVKKNKEGSVNYHHPWVFSGALHEIPKDVAHGALVHIKNEEGKILGTGTFSKTSSIAVRLFDFKEVCIDKDWFIQKIRSAQERREALGYGPGTETTGYRVIFGEADGIPGLVLDRFEDTLVFQLSTAGMDAQRATLIEAIETVFSPKNIIEKSELSIRKEEGLEEIKAIHKGSADPVSFLENGNTFFADPWEGQKTGFFTDQKELRLLVEKYAKNKTVLDLFCYSGATGIYALRGGAKTIAFVDGSESALELCKKHIHQNAYDSKDVTYTRSDAFEFLSKTPPDHYDFVSVDPPALIKTRRDEKNGKKAYHFLNRAALRIVKNGGIFVSSSCSHFLSEEDFLFMLRRAAVQAGVTLHVLGSVLQSPDHPLSLTFPESRYLKSILAWVEKN